MLEIRARDSKVWRLTNCRDVLGVAVHLFVAEVVVLVVDDHLAAYHLPPAAPPAQATPPAQPPARPAPARHLRLAPPPGGGGHRHTHAVSGEQVAALGPDGDVLGVEVSDAGEVHQSVVTCTETSFKSGLSG